MTIKSEVKDASGIFALVMSFEDGESICLTDSLEKAQEEMRRQVLEELTEDGPDNPFIKEVKAFNFSAAGNKVIASDFSNMSKLTAVVSTQSSVTGWMINEGDAGEITII